MSHLTLSTPFFYSLQMAIFILYANCQLLPEIAPLMRDKNIVDLLYIFEKFLGTIHDPHPNASQTLFLPHTLNLVSCFPCFSEKNHQDQFVLPKYFWMCGLAEIYYISEQVITGTITHLISFTKH